MSAHLQLNFELNKYASVLIIFDYMSCNKG